MEKDLTNTERILANELLMEKYKPVNGYKTF